MNKTETTKNFVNPSLSVDVYFRAECKTFKHSRSVFGRYEIIDMDWHHYTQGAFINRLNASN